MSMDATRKRKENGENGNGIVLATTQRLRRSANDSHQPDSYEDMQLDFSPLLFSSLERHLPPSMLNSSRDAKIHFMRDILTRYSPKGERIRVQKLREYRQLILSDYKRRYDELYAMDAASFFVPSFLKALNENTQESFRSIMTEPTPGVYTFEMLQPKFCEMLIAEVENFERWVHDTKFNILGPNTMNKFGVVLDDLGMETMLNMFMDSYILPMSRAFFPDVGGSTLDSHHGYVVKYGANRDVELDFHVDDSEVTLNVCLGEQFYGGDLYFRGIRCDKHLSTQTQAEEIFDYANVPGRAVLHRGRHRHGARATICGQRVNLVMWCKSSVFRDLNKYQKDFSSWCGECHREKKERQRQSIAATKQELLKRDGISA